MIIKTTSIDLFIKGSYYLLRKYFYRPSTKQQKIAPVHAQNVPIYNYKPSKNIKLVTQPLK
jgi:hypothetical protein